MKKIATTIAGCCLSLCSMATPGNTKELPAANIAFTENKGQITDQYRRERRDIDFKVASQGFNVFIGDGQLHYQWTKMNGQTGASLLQQVKATGSANITTETYRMDVTLIGANKNAVAITSDMLPFEERYYTTALSDGIVHSYKKITYKDIYPNIDWVLYTLQGASGKTSVKYDFVIRPGGKVSDIQVQYDGATALGLKNDGSLLAKTPMGEINEQAPYSYIISEGKKGAVVTSKYKLNGNRLSFEAGTYSGTLIIDPALVWGTYYGGNGFIELSTGLTCDLSANVYMAGITTSTNNIATVGSFQATFAGGFFDGYLVKLDANGVRKWATYYGGTGDEYTWGVACDKWGNVFLSGGTPSNTNIGTAGSYQPTKTGGGTAMFIVRFDSTGVRKWGTYYGTTGFLIGLCAVDNKGGVFLSGNTSATTAGLTTTGAFQPAKGGKDDGFLVKFDTACNRQWATYFGHDSVESMSGLACDTFGNVFMAGGTKSIAGIATTGSHQDVYAGNTDQYLVKFDGAGNRKWATYYGGPATDLDGETNVIGADGTGNVYLSGRTTSTSGIASASAYQSSYGGGAIDAFLVKFDSSGVRKWGTYFGGALYDVNSAVATNIDGETLMTGYTSSTSNITTAGSLQPTYAGGQYDAYLVRFDTDGLRIWSTYYGGANSDAGYGLAFAQEQSTVYIAGTTDSPTGIATTGSHQSTIGGSSSSFIAKLCVAALSAAVRVAGDDSICVNSTNTYTVATVPGATGYVWSLPPGWTGNSITNSIVATSNGTQGFVRVRVIKCDDTSAFRSLYVTNNQLIPAVIVATGNVLSTSNPFATYQWFLNGVAIAGATSATYTFTQNGDYRVLGVSMQGCPDTSVVYTVTGVSVNNVTVAGADVNIYPNPAKNTLYVQCAIPVTTSIYSMEGRIVKEAGAQRAIDITTFATGIYMVKITTPEGRLLKTERLVKNSN